MVLLLLFIIISHSYLDPVCLSSPIFNPPSDKMKNGVIAKIAMTASDEYAEALKLCQVSYIKEILPKEWIPIVAGKQAFMHATAEYYQSMVCQNAKNYGEEIGRLNVSTLISKFVLPSAWFTALALNLEKHIYQDLTTR